MIRTHGSSFRRFTLGMLLVLLVVVDVITWLGVGTLHRVDNLEQRVQALESGDDAPMVAGR